MMEIVKPKHDALTSNADRDGERVKHGDGDGNWSDNIKEVKVDIAVIRERGERRRN
jgi:hypothetical protein